jgi:hypothetical protein
MCIILWQVKWLEYYINPYGLSKFDFVTLSILCVLEKYYSEI